jgi:hypothetical protein
MAIPQMISLRRASIGGWGEAASERVRLVVKARLVAPGDSLKKPRAER